MHRPIVIALAALAASTVAAQEARPNPTDPQARVPGVEYRSAFEGYRPFAEEKLAPWRESNEAVKDGGDHASDATPAPAAPEPQAKPAAPEAKPPMGMDHGGHR